MRTEYPHGKRGAAHRDVAVDTMRRAHRVLHRAIRSGLIVRPSSCEACGATPTRKDGRAAIQGHHHDYSKPLDVKWVCVPCHRKETPWACQGYRNGAHTRPETRRTGERNGQSKLTAPTVAEIKQLQATGLYTNYRLSKAFGVNRKVLGDIAAEKIWRHVQPSAVPSTRDIPAATKSRGFASLSTERRRELALMAVQARRERDIKPNAWDSAAATVASAKAAVARRRNRVARAAASSSQERVS